jgi:hypothetical protein
MFTGSSNLVTKSGKLMGISSHIIHPSCGTGAKQSHIETEQQAKPVKAHGSPNFDSLGT